MNDLLEDLEEVCEKLYIDSDTRQVLAVEFFRSSINRFKHTFNEAAYKDIFDRIRRANDFLRRTVFQNSMMHSWRVQGQSRLRGAGIARFRRQAHTLRKGLLRRERWSCPCRDRHLFHLYLGGLQDRVASKTESVVFELAVGSRRIPSSSESELARWHMLKVQCDEDQEGGLPEQSLASSICGPAPPTTRVAFMLPTPTVSAAETQTQQQRIIISDLCSTIHAYSSSDGYLGHLPVSDLYKHGLFRMPWPWNQSRSLETVGQLLERLQQTHHHQALIFPRRSRLLVAAQLPLAVLILEGSWQVENWTSERLVLIRGARQTTSSGGFVHEEDALLLPCRLEKDGVPEVCESPCKTSQVRCAALFALGLTMIELSLGARFDVLPPPNIGSKAESTASKYEKALSLLPRVEEEDGEAYANVVERCLDCPFGVRKELSFDNSKFRDLVYENVVQPLQDNAAVFQRR